MTDGLCTSEVNELESFRTNWDTETLTTGELTALEVLIPSGCMGGSIPQFRDALIRAALDSSPPFQMPHDDGEPFNVLIVDRSHTTTAAHRDLVLLTRPSATVVAVDTVENAIAHLRKSEAAGMQVQLILADFDLDP